MLTAVLRKEVEEAVRAEREACAQIAADVERRYLRDGSSDGARAALDVQTEIMNRKTGK